MKSILRLFAITFLASLCATEACAQIDINTIDFSKPKYVLSPKQTNARVRVKPTAKSKINDDVWFAQPYFYASNQLTNGWYKVPGGYVSASGATAVKTFSPIPQKDFNKTWCGYVEDMDMQVYWRFAPVKDTDFYIFNIIDFGEFGNFYIAKKVDNMFLLYASVPVNYQYDPKNPNAFKAAAKNSDGVFSGITITFGRNKGIVYNYDGEGWDWKEQICFDLSNLTKKFIEGIFTKYGKSESYIITARHLSGKYYDANEPTMTSFSTNPAQYE